MALFMPVFPLPSFLSTLRRPSSGGRPSSVPPGTIYFQWDFKDVSDNWITLEYDGHENLLTKLFDAAAKMVSEDFVRLYASVDGQVQEILTEEKLLKAIRQCKRGPVQLLTPVDPVDASTVGSYSTQESLTEDLPKQPAPPIQSSNPLFSYVALDLSFLNEEEKPTGPQSTYDEDFYGHLEAYGSDVVWSSFDDILPLLTLEDSDEESEGCDY